jgi:hypothetical protein
MNFRTLTENWLKRVKNDILSGGLNRPSHEENLRNKKNNSPLEQIFILKMHFQQQHYLQCGRVSDFLLTREGICSVVEN